MNTKGELLQELSRRWLDVDENMTTSEVLLLEQLEKELNGLHPKYHEQWYNTVWDICDAEGGLLETLR